VLRSDMLLINIFINKLVVTDKKRVFNTPSEQMTIYVKRTTSTKKELIIAKIERLKILNI